MKYRSLLSTALVLLCLGSSPASYAGQDRMLFPPNGGPGHGGKISNILLIPSISTAFAGIEGGGIYKTTDDGANWVASHQGLGNMIVRGMALKPGTTSTMYAITNGGGGFYKSTDTGATWNVSNTGLSCTYVSSMIIVTTGVNAGRIIVTTACGGANGVFASSNEGASWTSLSVGQIPTSAQFITVGGPPDGSMLRANTSIGVYFSFDSGVTWAQRNGTLPNVLTGPNGAFVITTQVFGPNTLALVDGNGIFYSTDSGLNWTQANGLPPAADGVGGVSIIGSKLYYFVDGAGAYSSLDNGLNWAPDATLGGLPTKRTRQVFLSAGPTGWSSTLSGIYKTVNGGATWTRSSNGLPGGFVVNVTGVTGSPQTLFAAADTIYKSTDGGANWAVSDTGLGGATFLSTLQGRGVGPVLSDPSNSLVLYAATVSRGMYKSVDGGATWSAINNGLPANLTGKGGNFRISLTSPNVLYVPIGGVLFKTIDGGANWTNVWTSPTVSATQVRAPAIDPNDVNIVYAATSGGVFKSTDGGANWVAKHPGGFNLPFGTTRLQVMSGASQNLLLAALSGDARDVATSTSGVYLSTNGGDTWRQLVSNEKVTQAIFVNTPGSSKVSAYINSLGYFDQPSAGPDATGGVFKCADILGEDFEPARNCSQVDLGPEPGQHRSFFARADRVLGVTTTKGAARHQFMFLGPDFNNDSRADIFWRKAISGGNTVWQMSGAQFYGNPDGFDSILPFRAVDNNWVVAGMGDFDGNGTTDILWRHQLTGQNYIYFMDGGSILPSEGYIRTVADPAWQVAGVGDFDRDGRSDILWRNVMTGENYIYFMDGRTIVDEGFTRTVANSAWSVAAVGDFDGDGRADIFWRNSLTGENYFYLMNGRAIAGEGFIRSVSIAWQVKGLGDFNQDNRMDIVWRNPMSGENYVYPMNGLSILPTETYLPTVADMSWNIVSVGDFHGPDRVNESLIRGRGISGILWRHGLTGAAYLWSMSNPLKVDNSPCGAMGCPQGAFLPHVSDIGWQVTSK